MKKLLCLLLCAALAFIGGACAEGLYSLGDKMDDFTLTLADGSSVSLYELLEEKEVVLLNFWATWCPPCANEFPAIRDACAKLGDSAAVVALSVEPDDTNEIILDFQAEMGLENLLMGRDEADLYSRCTRSGSIPASVVIDRFGTVCFLHSGAMFQTAEFMALLTPFTGDGYTESLLLKEAPEVVLETETPEALSAVLGGEGIEFGSANDIPAFLISGDESCVYASAANEHQGISLLTAAFEAGAGDVLAYEYRVHGEEMMDYLTVSAGRDTAISAFEMYTGIQDEWTGGCVQLDEGGTQRAEFVFYTQSSADDRLCELRNVRIISSEEAAKLNLIRPEMVASLPGSECSMEVLNEGAAELQMQFNGEPYAFVPGERCYRVPDETVQVKICLGEEIDSRFAMVRFFGSETTDRLLSNYENDGEGYIVPVDASAGNMILFFPEPFGSGAAEGCLQLYSQAESAGLYLNNLLEQSGLSPDEAELVLLDENGNVFAATSGASPQELPEEAAYTIRCTNEQGEPVPGVMIQLCDEGSCMMLVTDAGGAAQHAGKPYPYEVHVLSVPEGYAAVEEAFVLPEAGGALDITLMAN